MVTTMPEPADKPKRKKEVSLKVDEPEGELISKLASMRRLSIARLFKERDLSDFLLHLYLAELKKEQARLAPPDDGSNESPPVAPRRGRK